MYRVNAPAAQPELERRVVQVLRLYESLTYTTLRQVVFQRGDYTDANEATLKAAIEALKARGDVLSQQAYDVHPRARWLLPVERFRLAPALKNKLTPPPRGLLSRLRGAAR